MRCLIPLIAALGLSPALASAGTLVLAGGGPEGDVGDRDAWSYAAYSALLEGGDVTGDGLVTVAILSTEVETDWLPGYFQWLGADEAYNLRIATRAAADDPAEVDVLRLADAIFIKGGDQGVYYDTWNDTRLEAKLRAQVEEVGASVGGTSAGAMSLSQFAFAGGKDLVSLDVLTDAQTPYLDDADGGSGIHDDFLGFLPWAVVDTHYTSRGRMGRLLGIHARILDEDGVNPVAIGIEEETALVVRGGEIGAVVGRGSVDVMWATDASQLRRDRRKPLVYTDVHLDRLVAGWTVDLADRWARLNPEGEPVTWQAPPGRNQGALTLFGDDLTEAKDLARTVTLAPLPFGIVESGEAPFIQGAVGVVDAQGSDRRGSAQESLFRALYEHPGDLGLLITDSAKLTRSSGEADVVSFRWNVQSGYRRAACIVVDGKGLILKGLSPSSAPMDTGSGSLRAAALLGLTVHVLADSELGQPAYDTAARALVP